MYHFYGILTQVSFSPECVGVMRLFWLYHADPKSQSRLGCGEAFCSSQSYFPTTKLLWGGRNIAFSKFYSSFFAAWRVQFPKKNFLKNILILYVTELVLAPKRNDVASSVFLWAYLSTLFFSFFHLAFCNAYLCHRLQANRQIRSFLTVFCQGYFKSQRCAPITSLPTLMCFFGDEKWQSRRDRWGSSECHP